jgi:soluble lytic murein transglycosylase-like protein
MRRVLLLFSLAGLAAAQDSPNPYEAVRAAMEAAAAKQREAARSAMDASLEKQRAAIRKQAEAARQVEPSAQEHPFFLLPWPAPVAMVNTAACDPLPEGELSAFVEDASAREGVEAGLLRAVIGKESGGRPCVVSPKGAQGLMQLMPATAALLNVQDPFDPRQNIDAGTRLLKQLITRYSGDLALALGAYNAGAGAVERHGGVPPYPETVDYVSGILNRVQ